MRETGQTTPRTETCFELYRYCYVEIKANYLWELKPNAMRIISIQTDSTIFQLQHSQVGSRRGHWSTTGSHHDTQDFTGLRKPVKTRMHIINCMHACVIKKKTRFLLKGMSSSDSILFL